MMYANIMSCCSGVHNWLILISGIKMISNGTRVKSLQLATSWNLVKPGFSSGWEHLNLIQSTVSKGSQQNWECSSGLMRWRKNILKPKVFERRLIHRGNASTFTVHWRKLSSMYMGNPYWRWWPQLHFGFLQMGDFQPTTDSLIPIQAIFFALDIPQYFKLSYIHNCHYDGVVLLRMEKYAPHSHYHH